MMPMFIDPAWEYITVDEDVAYGVYGGKHAKDEDRLIDPRVSYKDANPGMRFGRGNPNKMPHLKLAREKVRAVKERAVCKAVCDCGKEFVKVKASSRFCSVGCTGRSYRVGRGVKTCPECGVQFMPRYAAQKLCGNECRMKATLRRFEDVRAREPWDAPAGFAEDYDKGMLVLDLAVKYRVTRNTVYRWTVKLKKERRKTRTETRNIPREFAKRYLAGETMAKLAEAFGVCRPTLVRWRQRLGLPGRPRGNPRANVHKGVA